MIHAVVRRYHKAVTRRVENVHAGIDWISCSLGKAAPLRWEWAMECKKVIVEIAEDGHKIEETGINGYRGIKAGGSLCGDRDDGSYCQLTGMRADKYLSRIMRSDIHVSRLDVAVTVQFRTMPRCLGRVAYSAADEADRSLSGKRRRKIWEMKGTDGGHTVYIGSPSSDQRARMYNKEVQSGTPEYARSWRYEVEYRNDYASSLYAQLRRIAIEERPIWCAAVVAAWYRTRGVFIPWQWNADVVIVPQVAVKPSDAEKKLLWLSSQVAPALRWLIENNYGAEAYEALGIG
jgi:Replication initiation factor